MIFGSRMMNRPFGYANLNSVAEEWLQGKNSSQPNPLLDPQISAIMVRTYHGMLGFEWSYGGWLENRRHLHRETYLEKDKKWIHIGIDVNADVGTVVHAVADGPVVYTGDDSPLVGGWGGHIIQMIPFQESSHLLLYAHLGGIKTYPGELLKKGEDIARIGTPSENGHWFPHVHLQLFGEPDMVHGTKDWKKFSDEMDGYVRVEEAAKWARICPDPTPLIFGFSG